MCFVCCYSKLLIQVYNPGAGEFPGKRGRLCSPFFRPLFITGLVFYGLAMIAWVKVLSSEPLNLAYPVLVSITFALVVVTASILFKEPFGTYKIVGVLFLLIGITLMAQN